MGSRYDNIPSPQVTETGVAVDPSKKEVGKWEDNGTGSRTWVPKPADRPLDPGFSAPTSKPKVTPKPMPTPTKGTQADHHVTDHTSHTQTVKPMTPAQKQGEAKRPAVGNDKAVAKRVQGPSHNNGYTN
jgi:hypothetical protein